jgi:protein TonB
VYTRAVSEVDTARVYTYVEQMPQLPGGGGQRAIVEAVSTKLSSLKLAKPAQGAGQLFVKFIVNATGQVQHVEMVKGLAPAYDEAVLAAVRQLPTFEPGRQDGKAVSVSFTLPVSFQE